MHLAEAHGMLTMQKEVDLVVQVQEDIHLQLVLKDQEVLVILEVILHQKEMVVVQEVIQITKVVEAVAELQLRDHLIQDNQEDLEVRVLQT
jgi:hypothetical protein